MVQRNTAQQSKEQDTQAGEDADNVGIVFSPAAFCCFACGNGRRFFFISGSRSAEFASVDDIIIWCRAVRKVPLSISPVITFAVAFIIAFVKIVIGIGCS